MSNDTDQLAQARGRPASERTMIAKTERAETGLVDDRELDLVCGGFTLIELLVPIKEISIIMGMQVPTPQKVRDA